MQSSDLVKDNKKTVLINNSVDNVKLLNFSKEFILRGITFGSRHRFSFDEIKQLQRKRYYLIYQNLSVKDEMNEKNFFLVQL